jgi:pectin methylesterase-like acyl-CoA thioesterase
VLFANAAETVTIPTAAGEYIDWNACDLTAATVENSGANIGSTGKNTVATFSVSNPTQQDYILTFATGSQYAAKMQVTLTNTANSSVVLTKSVDIVNTGSWTPSTISNLFLSQLPAGTYELKMQVTEATSYAGNWGKLAFYTTESFNTIPGTIGIASGGYAGGARLENNNTNVGWVSNGTSATYSFICSEAGVYKMTIPMTRYGDGTITTIVTDDETNAEEANGTWTMTNPSNYEPVDVPVEGELTTGMKTLTMRFATTSSFLFNYKDFTMTRVGDHYSKIAGVAVTGQTVTTGDDSDWFCQLPASYDATTTFSVTALYGTVAATAEGISITDNGDGTFTLPTPAPGSTTTVTLTLTPAAGTFSSKTTYTLKLFRIGEISLTDVLVDGMSIDVLSDMNDNLTATYNNIYTAVPTVKVKVVDGSTVTAPAPTVSATKATYSIHVEMAGKTKDYTLVVDGLHIYNKVEGDETVNLKYTSEGNDKDNNIWSNGLYTLSPIGDGWNNSGFKMRKSSTNTLTVPSDVVVKQFIIHQFSDNYAPGSFGTLTSEGMTAAYIPAKHDFVNGSQYDLVVNLDGHQAGRDIVFTLVDGSQPTGWFELTIEKQAVTTAPVVTAQSVTVVNNHAVVALTFDREMTTTTATINGSTVTAEGGSATLYFPVWSLDYSKDYTLTIAAGAAEDTYGNSNSAAIEVAVSTEAKPVVAAVAYDYVVSTIDELKTAVAAVNSSNNNASAARKTIFLRNGDYNMETTELRISGYNISLIGESRDGVVIRGQRGGISNPTVNLRDRSGFYLQDLTLLNDLNYYKPLQDKESTGGGVGVAVYGGDKTVMKNVRMLGAQDTQVTGHRAYFEDCEIHGTVDFICGGGDNFYYRTNLVVERNNSCITAPSTSSTLKWGYVFQQCTIDGIHDGNTDAGYSLGRPWQDTPRCYYLNTTMNIQPADNGWTGMGTLPTYFYEYSSTDKDGNAIDLTVRGNSPTSTNSYTPVLTDGEAAKFTLENVLGGTDSWLPTDYTVEVSAPAVSLAGSTISWDAVADARCYVIFKNGQYVANQTATSYDIDGEGVYTVRAANDFGGLGKESIALVFKRTVKAGNWSTIVVPFDMDSEQLKAAFGNDVCVAAFDSYDAGVITMASATALKANVPYMIKVGSNFDAAVVSGATVDFGTPVLTLGQLTVTGSYSEVAVPKDSYYCYQNYLLKVGDDTAGKVRISPFRAYFTVSDGSRELRLAFEGETTGVHAIDNSKLTIDNSVYDLQGRRIDSSKFKAQSSKLNKGLYIVNGKKYVIK